MRDLIGFNVQIYKDAIGSGQVDIFGISRLQKFMMLSLLTPDLFGLHSLISASVCSDQFLLFSSHLNLYMDA
jgi:hypothetical protein